MEKRLSRRSLLLGGAALFGAGMLSGLPGVRPGGMSRAFAAAARPDYIIRANTNENPYGPSEVALRAIDAALVDTNKYGGITNELKAQLAEIEQIPVDHIMVGTGSGEILNIGGLIANQGSGSIVVPDPTFDTLPRYAERQGVEVIRVPVNARMDIDLGAIASAIKPDTRMVYLCNPNNPIPAIIEKNALRDFVLEVARDRLVFIDEAYYEYVDNPDYSSMLQLVRDGHRNIIISRTASKIHGIAGLRIGFGYSHPDTIKTMEELQTGSLNILGQHAALASYRDQDFQAFSKAKNRESLAIVETMLAARGIPHIKSNTNFSFFKTGRDISEVSALMREQGILIGRPFPPFRDWARVSMQKPEDMAYFVTVYNEFFG
ncbi:MAG: histidinol-phosphate transaminase [Pseudomonadales bacterium]|nr:histidinol-phosphate transaminase [Pseudomonadales bacterium]